MTRLKRTWPKPEVAVDQKGYVMITPVKRPSSPASPVNPPTLQKPLAISSMTYENFIPLKTRNFEVRRERSLPDEVPKDAEEFSPLESGIAGKPEKPDRHCYVNCELKDGE